jgi:transcriptional regulator with XRE-family HTH domain
MEKRKINTRMFRKLVSLRYDTDAEFADNSGLCQSHVSLLIAGKRNLTLGDLDQVGLALGIHPGVLFILLFDSGDKDRISQTKYGDRLKQDQVYLCATSVCWDFLKEYAYACVTAKEKKEESNG